MLITTQSHNKFETSIQLQREEPAEKLTKVERSFDFVSDEATDTAVYLQIACNLFPR